MAATGFLNPRKQFFDDSGNPLAAGLVYTYEAGTVTPLTTYNDSDLDPAHANANPIVLDAGGRCTIFPHPTTAMKIIVKTSAGVTVDTADEASPAEVGA